MNKKKIFLILLLCLTSSIPSFAAELEYIKSLTVSPDYIKAGESLHIKVSLQNKQYKWEKDKYRIVVNFISNDKILDSLTINGEKDISPYTFFELESDYRVPENWSGEITAEFNLVVKENKVEKYTTSFIVKSPYEIPTVTPLPNKFNMNGNISLYSYHSNKKELTKDEIIKNGYLNSSINFAFPKISFDGNFNTYRSYNYKTMTLNLNKRNVLKGNMFFDFFNIYPKVYNTVIGSVFLQDGMQGGYTSNRFSLFGLTGKLQKAKEGYTYERTLNGARMSGKIINNLELGFTYTNIYDNKQSIQQGWTSPIKNSVVGTDLNMKIWKINISGEYAESNYTPDTSTTTSQNQKGKAYIGKINFLSSLLEGEYDYVDPKFVSAASYIYYSAKERYSVKSTLPLQFILFTPSWLRRTIKNQNMNLMLNYSVSYNLDDKPYTRKIEFKGITFNTMIKQKGNLSIGTNLSLEKNPYTKTTTDQKTISFNYPLFKILSFNSYYSFSHNKTEGIYLSKYDYYNLSSNFQGEYKRIWFNAGYNTNKNKDLLSNRETVYINPNLNLKFALISGKLFLSPYYSHSINKDNQGTLKTIGNNFSTTLSYQVKHFSFSTTYSYNKTKDTINNYKNYDSRIEASVTLYF